MQNSSSHINRSKHSAELLCGNEVQLIHEPSLIQVAIDEPQHVDPIEGFRYAAPPHAGVGKGLERTVIWQHTVRMSL